MRYALIRRSLNQLCESCNLRVSHHSLLHSFSVIHRDKQCLWNNLSCSLCVINATAFFLSSSARLNNCTSQTRETPGGNLNDKISFSVSWFYDAKFLCDEKSSEAIKSRFIPKEMTLLGCFAQCRKVKINSRGKNENLKLFMVNQLVAGMAALAAY